jgi:DNA-binding response OmpR family regulator
LANGRSLWHAGEHALWGGDRYLLKPFDLEELLRMIRELIGEA